MTREEAEALCARLRAEHPDRSTHQWHAREGDDGAWSVVKIALAPAGTGELHAEQRADERPATPGDPRSITERQLGGPWVGPG